MKNHVLKHIILTEVTEKTIAQTETTRVRKIISFWWTSRIYSFYSICTPLVTFRLIPSIHSLTKLRSLLQPVCQTGFVKSAYSHLQGKSGFLTFEVCRNVGASTKTTMIHYFSMIPGRTLFDFITSRNSTYKVCTQQGIV